MHMRTAKLLLAALAVVVLMKCSQSLFTAPPGSSMHLIPNPRTIPPNGGVSVITAVVTDGTGQPVPDGTIVQFFTDLGRIDPLGRTNDGIAKVNLVSDGRSGTANLKAFSGGGAQISDSGASPTPGATPAATGNGTGAATTAVETVLIGSASTLTLILSADPRNIARDGPRFSTLTATVIDKDSNPIANIPVIFRAGSDKDEHFSASLESRGLPVYTDNNGQARDRVWTAQPRDGGTDLIPVSARTLTGAATEAATTIGVNFF
jgi:hypothetical protein